MFDRGTIILIPFPFTDLSAHKVRPALIISKGLKGENMIVAFISSRNSKLKATDIVIKNSDSSFAATGLRKISIIKIDKIATLDKKLALGELGRIDKKLEQEINKKLKLLFNL